MSQASKNAGRMVYRAYTLKRHIVSADGLEKWQARDDNKKRTVTLVFLPDEIFQNSGVLDELEKEIRDCSQLDHHHLVHVRSLQQDAKSAAIDMQFVEGQSISEKRSAAPNSFLEVEAIRIWMAQLCHVMSYVNRRVSFPHGNLIPANLILTPTDELKLSGLGLSKLSGQIGSSSGGATGKGSQNAYQSPQQVLGHDATTSDDLYAVGSIIYELLTTKPPFHGDDLLGQIMNDIPPSMQDRRKELGIKGKSIPQKWEAAVAACLAKEPKDRPASFADLAKRLGLPDADSEKPPSISAKKKIVINKFQVMVAAAAFVFLSLTVAGGWWLTGLIREELQRQAEVKRLEAEEQERVMAERAARKEAEAAREQAEIEAAAAAEAAQVAEQKALEAREKEAERLALARGGLRVNTDPPRANVTLTADNVLKTPAEFDSIRLGKKTILIEKSGYVSIEREVEIKENEVTDLGTVTLTRETGNVSIVSQPAGAIVYRKGQSIGKTPLTIKKEPTGKVSYQLQLDGHLASQVQGRVNASESLKLDVQLQARPAPSAGKSWENDIGMKFQPVKGLDVLFAQYETRVKDFRQFVSETGYNAESGMRSLQKSRWGQYGHSWKDPGFEQGDKHPVVGVNWNDAKAFCKWLTERDRAAGVLSDNQSYRLPTDAEWSLAVRLQEDSAETPEMKNGDNTIQYPWGTDWPLPREIGNYAGHEVKKSSWPKKWEILEEHRDQFARTAPVGSFPLRFNELRDMSGNVWEWCED
ncbi:MAG: bifunctional serine/threonine-protein kinase/formylglycine-generating enzyme family protein, partial [Verrucomicrobiota bacterium]